MFGFKLFRRITSKVSCVSPSSFCSSDVTVPISSTNSTLYKDITPPFARMSSRSANEKYISGELTKRNWKFNPLDENEKHLNESIEMSAQMGVRHLAVVSENNVDKSLSLHGHLTSSKDVVGLHPSTGVSRIVQTTRISSIKFNGTKEPQYMTTSSETKITQDKLKNGEIIFKQDAKATTFVQRPDVESKIDAAKHQESFIGEF